MTELWSKVLKLQEGRLAGGATAGSGGTTNMRRTRANYTTHTLML